MLRHRILTLASFVLAIMIDIPDSAANVVKDAAKSVVKTPFTLHCPSSKEALRLVIKEAENLNSSLLLEKKNTYVSDNDKTVEIDFKPPAQKARTYIAIWDLTIPLQDVTDLSLKVLDAKTFMLMDKGVAFDIYGGHTDKYTIPEKSNDHCLYKAKTKSQHNIGYIGLFNSISYYATQN